MDANTGKKKKILILGNSSGGLYDFRNEFIEALLKENEVFISVPDDVRTKELCAEGAHVIHTDINRRGVDPLEDIKLYLSYRRLMKEIKPDLAAVYTIKPNIYGGFCARMMNIPYIATITGLGGAFDRTGLFVRFIVGMYRAGLKKAECVFFRIRKTGTFFGDTASPGKRTNSSWVPASALQGTEWSRIPKTIRYISCLSGE